MWPGADPEAMARGRWALAGRVVRDASDASEPAPGGHGMDKGRTMWPCVVDGTRTPMRALTDVGRRGWIS